LVSKVSSKFQTVLGFIRRVNKSINLFLFVFTYGDLAQALAEAVARGCVVRVYLDKGLANSVAARDVIQVLVDGGVQVRFRRSRACM
jgi:phosphatidylserine/phosphatidylglycerophosphate/cardiolipin synthase-like enzyme